jgi:hypothetical protein
MLQCEGEAEKVPQNLEAARAIQLLQFLQALVLRSVAAFAGHVYDQHHLHFASKLRLSQGGAVPCSGRERSLQACVRDPGQIGRRRRRRLIILYDSVSATQGTAGQRTHRLVSRSAAVDITQRNLIVTECIQGSSEVPSWKGTCAAENESDKEANRTTTARPRRVHCAGIQNSYKQSLCVTLLSCCLAVLGQALNCERDGTP